LLALNRAIELDETALVIFIFFTKDLSVAVMPAWRENTVHVTVFDAQAAWLPGLVLFRALLLRDAIIDSMEWINNNKSNLTAP
jgi:hypothetical protein